MPSFTWSHSFALHLNDRCAYQFYLEGGSNGTTNQFSSLHGIAKSAELRRCLVVFSGVSFSLDEQNHYGQPTAIEGQNEAFDSHMAFLQSLEDQHAYRCDVAIRTDVSFYGPELCLRYSDNAPGYVDCRVGSPLDEVKPMAELPEYDFVFRTDINLVLKPTLAAMFDPSWSKIMFHSVSLTGTEEYAMQFWPKKFANSFPENTFTNLIGNYNLGVNDIGFMLPTGHTKPFWSPLFRVANTPPNPSWDRRGMIFNSTSMQFEPAVDFQYQDECEFERFLLQKGKRL